MGGGFAISQVPRLRATRDDDVEAAGDGRVEEPRGLRRERSERDELVEAVIEAFTGGDPAMAASLRRVYENEDAETVSRGMVTAERMAYMQAVLAAAGS